MSPSENWKVDQSRGRLAHYHDGWARLLSMVERATDPTNHLSKEALLMEVWMDLWEESWMELWEESRTPYGRDWEMWWMS